MPKVVQYIRVLCSFMLLILLSTTNTAYGQVHKAVSAAPVPQGDFNLPENISIQFCFNELTGNDSVRFSILNAGIDTIRTMDFYWISDGVIQGPHQVNQTILAGDDEEVIIDGFNFNTPGVYTYKLWGDLPGMTNLNPSDDTLTLSIEVFAVPQPAPMPDVYKCLNDSAKVVAPNGYAQYNWQNDSHDQFTFVNGEGNYHVELIDNNGCKVSDSVKVINHAYPNDILVDDTAMCSGQSIELVAPIGFDAYVWGGGLPSHANRITVTQSGVYEVEITDSNNCSYSDVSEVIVDPVPTTSLPAIVAVCEGNNADIDASNPAENNTFLWNSGSPDAVLSTATAGTYTVTVTNTYGCTTVGSTSVQVNPNPTPQLTTDSILCNGEIQTLAVSDDPYHTFEWSTSATQSSIHVSTGGVYSVTVTDGNNCTGTTTINMVEKTVSVDLGQDRTICENDVVTLSLDPNEYQSFLWNDLSTDFYLTILEGGEYTVEVTKYNTCTAKDTVSIDVTPLPVSDYSFANVNGNEIHFTNLSNVSDSLLWDFGDGTTSKSIHPVRNYTYAGHYDVTLTVYNDCGYNVYRQKVPVGITATHNLSKFTNLTVYPNPAQDVLHISLNTDGFDFLSITLQNELGQIVRDWSSETKSTDHVESINVSGLATGVYFLSLKSGDVFETRKVIVY